MADKTMDIFLMVFFGVAGIAVLILAWTQSTPVSERVLSTSAGLVGLVVVLVRTLALRTRAKVATVPVESGVEDKA